MVPEGHYRQMKTVTQEIKQLYQSRRYIQCANVCERSLSRDYDELHPVHKAYLHFYFALVHDTMARETTLAHRSAGLDLAEHHYLLAMSILTPSEPYNLDDIFSPSSIGSKDEHPVRYRRGSDHSHHSAVSSTTTLSEEQDSPWEQINTSSTRTSSDSGKHRPTPIMAVDAARAYHKERFSADLLTFVPMVQAHLDSVEQLRSTLPAPRLPFTLSRSSTSSPRPGSRGSCSSGKSEPRWARKSVNFRPRFDPSRIQKLCNEVLSEL